MTILELEMKIAADRRMDRLPVNIGESPCYDEMFNLVRQENGKWATFYGEHGGTTNKREYDTEEEAADALWAILEAYRKEEARRKKQRRQEWWRKLRDQLKKR